MQNVNKLANKTQDDFDTYYIFPANINQVFFLQIRSLKWINGSYQHSQLFIHPSMVFTILRSNYAVTFQFVDKLKFLIMPWHLAIKFGRNQILIKESIYFSLQYCYCIKGFKYLHHSRFVWNCGPPLYYKVHGTQTNVCKFVSPFMEFLYTNVSSWIFMPYLYALMAHYHV